MMGGGTGHGHSSPTGHHTSTSCAHLTTRKRKTAPPWVSKDTRSTNANVSTSSIHRTKSRTWFLSPLDRQALGDVSGSWPCPVNICSPYSDPGIPFLSSHGLIWQHIPGGLWDMRPCLPQGLPPHSSHPASLAHRALQTD